MEVSNLLRQASKDQNTSQQSYLQITPQFGYRQQQTEQIQQEHQREDMMMPQYQMRDVERKSIMTPHFVDLKNSMKEKCIQRLNDQRRSYVQAYRETRLRELTESKRRPELINTEINDRMVLDNQIGNIIQDELKNYQEDYDLDQLIEAYEEIQKEMQEYLVHNHMRSFEFDEAYHYELYERANSKETELHAQIYDPNNRDIYICALCKNLIMRVNRTKLTCSKNGCIDIDLCSEKFRPQEVMDYVQKSVLEHRETIEQSQHPNDCANREHETFKVCLRTLSFLNQDDENGMQGVESEKDLNIVIECTSCTHLDFIGLESLLREY